MPPIYEDYCDETDALKNNDNHETCHLDLKFQSHDSYFVEFAPTTIHEKKFAYVESNKNSILEDHEKNALCDGYIYKSCHDYDYPFSEHYSFNVETTVSVQVSYNTLTTIHEKNFAYVESSKFSMLINHEKNALCAGYIV